jgi:hypothetical protein
MAELVNVCTHPKPLGVCSWCPPGTPGREVPTMRGCCHLLPGYQHVSFRSSWEEIERAYCPNPALPDNDYCAEHAHLYEYLKDAAPNP